MKNDYASGSQLWWGREQRPSLLPAYCDVRTTGTICITSKYFLSTFIYSYSRGTKETSHGFGHITILAFSKLLVTELLAVDGELVHKSFRGKGERGHSLEVTQICDSSTFLRILGGGARTSSRRNLAIGAIREGTNICVCSELKVSFGKLLKCLLILKENDFAELLTSELNTKGELSESGIAYLLARHENFAFAVTAADTNASLCDSWEYSPSIGLIKVFVQACVLEYVHHCFFSLLDSFLVRCLWLVVKAQRGPMQRSQRYQSSAFLRQSRTLFAESGQ